jgi:hypothetical protein
MSEPASVTPPAEPAPATAPAAQPAPAAAPAPEPAKAASAGEDLAAQVKAQDKLLKQLTKELESTKARAAEADTLKSSLAETLGLGKKDDPAAAATALQERLALLEKQVSRNVAREAVRGSGVTFAPGVEPDDVLAFMGSIDVDVNAGALRDADGFKAALSGLLERKPFLQAPAKPAGPNIGIPASPLPVSGAPPQPAAPTQKVQVTGASIFAPGARVN